MIKVSIGVTVYVIAAICAGVFFLSGCTHPVVHTSSTNETRAAVTEANRFNDAAIEANTKARSKLEQIIYDAKMIKKLRRQK